MAAKLPRKVAVRELVQKAIESATLAVEVYNKPAVPFRTGAYCTMMTIAWTALLHAIFERDGIKYYYKERNGRFRRKDGDRIAWDLTQCIKKYWAKDLSSGIAKNLQLFVRLRNKVEHRRMRTIDAKLLPEAQSLLLNFKSVLHKEFGIEFLGDMGLYVPIGTLATQRAIPESADERSVLNFIDRYRDSLEASLWDDSEYAFRAYLVPKIGNHENSSDVTIEFINSAGLSDQDKRTITRITALIKSKQAPFDPALMKPKAVVGNVVAKHPGFSMHNFVNAWKKLGVRPLSGVEEPSNTDKKYCYHDPVDGDYRYEPAFCDLICEYIENGEQFADSEPISKDDE